VCVIDVINFIVHTHTHTQVHILDTHIPTDLYSHRTTEEQVITFVTFSAAVIIFCRTSLLILAYEQPHDTEIEASRFRLLFRTAVYKRTFTDGERGAGRGSMYK